ncbi:MAG TPA: M23 family metallopeptidase [Hyphomicrobiaceae bacterium]|jgi:murein DD-endopeptidase MepM/ murein hydrolase activator NlpD|nr:M23 family metallopeptidase [Hyphomicrobiaceae bacterium]
MRITRVVFSFFSVGFLASTFEQAAGLGDIRGGQRPSPVATAASTAAALVPNEVPDAEPAAGTRLTLTPTAAEDAAQSLETHEQSPGRLLLDAGNARAAETFAAAIIAERLPPGPGSLPVARRAFVALPQLESAQGVPDAQPEEQPDAFGVPAPTRVHEFIMPIDKGRVTSMFHQGRFHPAIDLAAPIGTPVRATTRKQTVTFAGRRGGYGNLVITRDSSGRQHYYGHLQRIIAGIGSRLEQGDLLGLLGSTGHSTGPHVHYEVRKSSGGYFNPATLLFPGLSVRPGYAWNDARFPTVAEVRSTTEVAARANVKRSVRAARNAKRKVRFASRSTRRARFAARAPVAHYYTPRRATRFDTRLAARFGQPRPR